MRRIRISCAGALGLAMLAVPAQAVTLGVSADGRFFTIDGAPVFLNGVSYYAAQSISTPAFVTADLDDMVKRGFNWIRVWVYWGPSSGGEDVSVLTHDGAIRPIYMDRLKRLIAECNSRGMIVDCSFHRNSRETGTGPRNQEEHLAAVRTLAKELRACRNVYFDVANERDVKDARYVSTAECGELIAAIKAIDPARLCTASCTPRSQSDLDDLRKLGKVDFITPHLGRAEGLPARTAGTVRQFVGWMDNLGFRIPVHLQEPLRRGYRGHNPTVDDFLRDCSGAKVAEAAGWCLHNGSNGTGRPHRSFLMSDAEGRLFAQFDSVEREVVASLKEQIAGTRVETRRYQAEYPEQLSHQTGARDGFTWSARVGEHAAGYLSLGPGLRTVPAGKHRVSWRLRIDSLDGPNEPVVTLDVAGGNGRSVLASVDIRRSDFTAAGAWQDYPLPFECKAGYTLEFRTKWHARARIVLDCITLSMEHVR